MISVILPVLNEEKYIENALNHLKGMKGNFETIVVDGGSGDRTVELAEKHCMVISSEVGRAVQMNTGANQAKGDDLFFLHADCVPESGAFLEIEEIMKDGSVAGGALKFDLDETSLIYKNHVFWSNLRARLSGTYLGDHGIFVRKTVFNQAGGFPSIPIMEDVALCKKIKKNGALVQAKSKITASSRRFKKQGFIKTVLLMWINRLLFWLGVSPEKLERYYRYKS